MEIVNKFFKWAYGVSNPLSSAIILLLSFFIASLSAISNDGVILGSGIVYLHKFLSILALFILAIWIYKVLKK